MKSFLESVDPLLCDASTGEEENNKQYAMMQSKSNSRQELLQLVRLAQLYLFQEQPAFPQKKKKPIHFSPETEIPKKTLSKSDSVMELPQQKNENEPLIASSANIETATEVPQAPQEDNKTHISASHNSVHPKGQFVLEPPSPLPPKDFKTLRALYTSLFPRSLIKEQPLENPTQMKLKVILLSFNDDHSHLQFLTNLAKAISTHYVPAEIIRAKEALLKNTLENILLPQSTPLILAFESHLFAELDWMQYYKHQDRDFLNHIPLILLSPLNCYLTEPKSKAILWRTIGNHFK